MADEQSKFGLFPAGITVKDNGDGSKSLSVRNRKVISQRWDSITRPNNAVPYAAGQAINCNLDVSAGEYDGTTVTLTSAGHPIYPGDRVTVKGIDAAYTWTGVDGDWLVTETTVDTVTFEVDTEPTGVTPGAGGVSAAIAKLMSVDLVSNPGDVFTLKRINVYAQGQAMIGTVRVSIFASPVPVAADEQTQALMFANAFDHRLDVEIELALAGVGSDMCIGQATLDQGIRLQGGDDRLYLFVTAQDALVPVAKGQFVVRFFGIDEGGA